jgi:hypothetical protein
LFVLLLNVYDVFSQNIFSVNFPKRDVCDSSGDELVLLVPGVNQRKLRVENEAGNLRVACVSIGHDFLGFPVRDLNIAVLYFVDYVLLNAKGQNQGPVLRKDEVDYSVFVVGFQNLEGFLV